MSLPGPRSEATGARTPGPPRAALITGAARRLGRAIALALADAGWDVAIHYHQSRDDAEVTAAEVRARGRRAALVTADLAIEAEVRGLVAAASRALGPIGLLVNNASRFRHDTATDVSYASLIEHLLPNLAAPLVLGRELAAALAAADPAASPADGRGGPDHGGVGQDGIGHGGSALDGPDPGGGGQRGVIVNLLDQKLYSPNPDFLSYTLSKAALAQATVMLAQALAPRVRVVGIAPGLTLPSYLQDDAAFKAAHQRYSPLGRSSTPADIAATVVFVADNPAITGSVLVVDGGQHLLGLPRDVSLMPPRPDPSRQ